MSSTDFVDDYELGQVVMREMSGGKFEPSGLDPAFLERVGHDCRPVLRDAAAAFAEVWRSVPWRVRVRIRVVGWLAKWRGGDV